MREPLQCHFTFPAGTRVVPLGWLVPTKHQPKSIAVALSRMEEAKQGCRERREPLSVQRISMNKYSIIDGNATYGAALRLGWRYIPIRIVRGQRARIEVGKLTRDIEERDYPGVFHDTNKDGIWDVDDATPRSRPGKHEQVEETLLSSAVGSVIQRRKGWEGQRKRAVIEANELLRRENLPGRVTSRSKTPYSVINKLVKKRLDYADAGMKGLTDLVGLTIVTPTYQEMVGVTEQIESGALGEVVEKEDFITSPKCGYRSIHYLIVRDGKIMEVQVKPEAIAEAQDLSHTSYKVTNVAAMTDEEQEAWCAEIDRVFFLALLASQGDVQARAEFIALLRRPSRLLRIITSGKRERRLKPPPIQRPRWRRPQSGRRANIERLFGANNWR